MLWMCFLMIRSAMNTGGYLIRTSRFAVAAITAIAISLLLTYGTYAIRLLAGGPLTRRYIIWSSFLLPIFLGLFAAVWPAPKLKRSALAAGSAGAAIGLAYIYHILPKALVP
jgi:hypothetical protein